MSIYSFLLPGIFYTVLIFFYKCVQNTIVLKINRSEGKSGSGSLFLQINADISIGETENFNSILYIIQYT